MSQMPEIIDRLRVEQRRLLATAERLEALVAGPHPGDMEALASLRWSFTRDMLLHFANLEATVLQPLIRDSRAEAVAQARRSSADLRSVYDQFMRHAARWKGLPEPESWQEYRAAIALLVRRIRVRILAQEGAIYPLLPARPSYAIADPGCEPLNYVEEAWKVRSVIYADGTAATPVL
jgi:hypothetical protein